MLWYWIKNVVLKTTSSGVRWQKCMISLFVYKMKNITVKFMMNRLSKINLPSGKILYIFKITYIKMNIRKTGVVQTKREILFFFIITMYQSNILYFLFKENLIELFSNIFWMHSRIKFSTKEKSNSNRYENLQSGIK